MCPRTLKGTEARTLAEGLVTGEHWQVTAAYL